MGFIALWFLSFFVTIYPVAIATSITGGLHCYNNYSQLSIFMFIGGFIGTALALLLAFAINPLIFALVVVIVFFKTDEANIVFPICFVIYTILLIGYALVR